MRSLRHLPTTTTFLLGLIVALAAPVHAASAAAGLSQEQALDAARRHILADEDDVLPESLVEHEVIPLDANTWGKYYYAFHFPKRGNTQYQVSKESGFVQPILVLTDSATWTSSYAASADPASLRNSFSRLPPLTLTKAELWSDYVITVTFPEGLAAEDEAIGFGCQLWRAGENVPPYHHPEIKKVVTLKSVNHVRELTLTISKTDAARFPIIDVFLLTANSGSHVSPRITDIPGRSRTRDTPAALHPRAKGGRIPAIRGPRPASLRAAPSPPRGSSRRRS